MRVAWPSSSSARRMTIGFRAHGVAPSLVRASAGDADGRVTINVLPTPAADSSCRLAAVTFHDAADDGETHTFPRRPVRVQPLKGLEHLGAVSFRDAQSVVLDVVGMAAGRRVIRRWALPTSIRPGRFGSR